MTRPITLLLFLAATGAALAQTTAPSNTVLNDLDAHLASMVTVERVEVRFACEKRLAALDSPLLSSGRLWIRKATPARQGQPALPAGVRFLTDKPYTSELILSEGKVYGRSQHEDQWTINTQSNRPGLSSIMSELGDLTTGGQNPTTDAAKTADKLAQQYDITRGELPPAPPASSGTTTRPALAADTFILTPKDETLRKAIKQLDISFQRDMSATAPSTPAPSKLVYLKIESAEGDITRYWFVDPKINGDFSTGDAGKDMFKPTGGP